MSEVRERPIAAASGMIVGRDDVRRSGRAIGPDHLLDQAGIGVHLLDPDGTILYASTAALNLLGYEAGQHIGRRVIDFCTDKAAGDDMLSRLSGGEEIERQKVQLRARDGSVRHVEVTCTPQSLETGGAAWRCLVVDVTAVQTAHDEAIGQCDLMRQALNALPVAVYTTDRDGKITYCNPAAVNLAGREPVIGEDEWCVTFKMFRTDGTELPHAECPMAIALKEDRPVRDQEALAQRPDGTLFPFRPYPTPLHDANGELTGAVNMLEELSASKRADQVGRHFSAIVESSFDAIVSKDLNGIINSWNRAAERLFGYTAAEAIGNPVAMLIPCDHQDEEPRILARIRSGERVESYETIRQRKDGSLVPVSLTVSPVRDASGRIVGASKIARDISAAKESEHRIRTLMREVNHRVKNQYAVILSMIRETSKRSEHPDVFERQVRERIMALARSHDLLVSGDWKGASIAELLLAQVKPFGNEERMTVSGPTFTLSPNAVQYLGIAFHELATNSAKYGVLSNFRGSITVEWRVVVVAGVRRLLLTWTETDGPKVVSIARSGFGTVVLKRVAPIAMSGTGELHHEPGAIRWTLDAPMASVEAAAPGSEED